MTNEINGEGLARLNMRAVEYGPIKRSLLSASKTDTVLERMSEAAFRDIIIKVIIYLMYFFGGRCAPSPLRGGIRGGRITDAAPSPRIGDCRITVHYYMIAVKKSRTIFIHPKEGRF